MTTVCSALSPLSLTTAVPAAASSMFIETLVQDLGNYGEAAHDAERSTVTVTLASDERPSSDLIDWAIVDAIGVSCTAAEQPVIRALALAAAVRDAQKTAAYYNLEPLAPATR